VKDELLSKLANRRSEMVTNTMTGTCDGTGKPRLKDRAHKRPVEFTFTMTERPSHDQAYCPACGALVFLYPGLLNT
jgi:hypothetical protein